MHISAILLAAGSGQRFQEHNISSERSKQSKQFVNITSNTTILDYCINNIQQYAQQIIIVLPENNTEIYQEYQNKYPQYQIVYGSNTRVQSTYQALKHINNTASHILIHDIVRPVTHQADLQALILSLDNQQYTGSILGKYSTNTVKQSINNSIQTLDRQTIFLAETPQVFEKNIYMQALKYCIDNNLSITDDASAIEQFSKHTSMTYNIQLIESQYPNPKLTVPSDLEYIQYLVEYYI